MNRNSANNSANSNDALPKPETGNASNPPATDEVQLPKKQLLDEKAETYLREGGNIEDMPDEKDWNDANQTIEETKE